MTPVAAHIVLMGMMGAGKTTVGRALAHELGVAYADNDDALVARTGQTAAAFAQDHGVDALHRVEHEILSAAVRRDDGAVVGAPGSVALDPHSAVVLAGQRVVWLRAGLPTLEARIHHDPARPLVGAHPAVVLAALMAEREPAFRRLATVVVDVDGLSAAEIVARILAEDQGSRSIESPNSCQR